MNENNMPVNPNEDLDAQTLEELQAQMQMLQQMDRRRRLILCLRFGAIVLLLIIGLLVVAFITNQNAKNQHKLNEVRQMQNEYNRMLSSKETELGIELRPFTSEEEKAMQSGERDPKDVISKIVEECATPVPEFSGKTQEEIIEAYNSYLLLCEQGFLDEIEALIDDAGEEWPEAKKTQSGKSNWLTKYTAMINQIELRADKEFDEYMSTMRSDLKDIDGSLDDDDIAVVSSFYARYNEEKERTLKRFTEAYHLSEN